MLIILLLIITIKNDDNNNNSNSKHTASPSMQPTATLMFYEYR